MATPTVPSPICVGLDLSLLEPQRDLAGNREQFDRQSWQRLERLAELHGAARNDVAADDVEDAVRADHLEGRPRAPDRERLALAQAQAGLPRDRRRCWSTAPRRSANGAPRPFGCSAGVARICWRTSIEALSKSQFAPSTLTARLDWVRGLTRLSPLQARRHTRQPQFHCGTPPPAPEPSTSALSRGAGALSGDIVEARRDMDRTAGGGGKWADWTSVRAAASRSPSPEEWVIANDVRRPRRADRERNPDDAFRSAGAGGLRIEEPAANRRANLRNVSRLRRGAGGGRLRAR